jgi:hypothetical protein
VSPRAEERPLLEDVTEQQQRKVVNCGVCESAIELEMLYKHTTQKLYIYET